MELVNDTIRVTHREKGVFILPMSSVSWYVLDPAATAPARRGRPRKKEAIAAA